MTQEFISTNLWADQVPSFNGAATREAKLGFAESEHYGPGIWVKQIDFQAKSTRPPFKSTYFQILPGFETPVDKHKVEEVWIVLQGTGILNYDGQESAIGPQDVLHFDSYKGHRVRNNSAEPLLICSIYW